MGNQSANLNQRKSIINPNRSKFSRNSYSLDSNSLLSQYRQKLDKEGLSIKQISPVPPSAPILLQRFGELSRHQVTISSPQINGTEELVKETMKKSLSLPINKKNSSLKAQNDSRLTKLNQKNDQLRKQLIKISSELSAQLTRKKFEQKKKVVVQTPKQQDFPKLVALRRQLQNGYKQINRLKKHIQNLKKNEGNARNQDLMNQVQAKINNVQFDSSEILFEIENARSVNQEIRSQLLQSQGIADFTELEPFKIEIQKLRKHAKKLYKGERVRFQKQKIMQQYMFQLERKKREINGEYLPEIKSYANKNYQPDPKPDKKKNDEYANYKPAPWQIRSVQEQLSTLKQKHQQYHLNMDKALRLKNTIKQEHQQIKKDLQSANKQLQHLVYKKQRYMQMVMGNLQYLMNENDQEQEVEEDRGGNDKNRSVSMRVVTKGNDLPDQKFFDDHILVANVNYTQIRIVSVNIWFTNKHQISTVQMIYSNGKDCFLGHRSANVSGQMQKQVLELDEGDFIRNMMGIFNKKGAIQFLAFYSAKGKAKQFGKEMINGLNFTLGLTRRQRPVCISGYSFFDGNYWRINKLIVDVATEQ